MTPESEYGTPHGEADVVPTADMLSAAFASSPADSRTWIEQRLGLEQVRVLREAGVPVGTLAIIPMGQWFGGKSVRMAGIAGVAVAPHRRASGVATELMRHALNELHSAGWPLSTLFPATQPLYRRAGYEQAGSRCEVQFDAWQLAARERDASIRPITADDAPTIESIYKQRAAASAGMLDRGPYMWQRIREQRGETARGFLAERAGRAEGYLYYLQKRHDPSAPCDLNLTDFVALTPQAARRLLTFLADHRSTTRHVIWHSGPADPILALLPEQHYRLKLRHYWMLRIVNLPAALSARGYSPAISAELHLDVQDEWLPANNGRFVLQVRDGHAHVEPGGEGRLRLTIRALAMIYSGFLSPAEAALTGCVEATASDLETAGAVFAGPAPWMPDMF